MTEAEIRELVGEIIVAGFDSLTVNEHARRLVVDHRVKNIILFKRNVENPYQLRMLTEGLQETAHAAGHQQPLVICTDQENGIVRRVAPGVPGLPGNMAVGATGNRDNAATIGRLTAQQLLAVGVNMNLAPVLDVNNNAVNPVIGVRSYGDDPERVAEFGTAMIDGLQSEGVIACAKHFPGHGDTSIDSHLQLPEVAHSRDRLEQVELKPFKRAIASGVDVIMTAHVVFSSMEPRKIPATLSKAVLTDFLRGELGYQGVVTTDCLEMNAISETVGVGEGAVQALMAGADMLMVSHLLERQEAAIEAVVKAVLEGRVQEDRLEQAASTVRRLRTQRLQYSGGQVRSIDSLMEKSAATQSRICAAAATVVSNDKGLLPLYPAGVRVVELLVDSTVVKNSASDNTATWEFIVDALNATFPAADVRIRRFEGAKDSVTNVSASTDASLVVAALNGASNSHYIAFIRALTEAGKPVTVLALQSPYDLSAVAAAPTQVAIYEYTPWMVRAGIEAMVGKGGTGQLPVTL